MRTVCRILPQPAPSAVMTGQAARAAIERQGFTLLPGMRSWEFAAFAALRR
jgi:hypothetical protein